MPLNLLMTSTFGWLLIELSFSDGKRSILHTKIRMPESQRGGQCQSRLRREQLMNF